MRVFVVNSGSSSIKYQLIDTASGERVLAGTLERIGEEGGDAPDHTSGMRQVLDALGHDAQIAAVGHRVVHGGARFTAPTLIDDAVVAAIDELSALAPLHNPANLAGVIAARTVLPDVPHVAVFDTAFHQSMPPEAYTYAIDRALAERYGVRKYGFHGTSHQFVAGQAAAVLGRPLEELKLIVLHLGNGASVTAVDGGRSIDTSMGLTPLQGLVMGTRSGDLDPAVLVHLHRVAGLSVDEIDALLNKRSGLLGLTGRSDMRDVTDAAAAGDELAEAALAVWAHRIRHYVGAYLAQLGGLDAVVFTAGVGENAPALRARALAGLDHLGIRVDRFLNERPAKGARIISPALEGPKVLVVPTNEELAIARQAAQLVAG
ncbi:acetate kinase [Microcella alkaliphila]|uniref:Acetate kinase n=2 Tax=Microcella alkaliphila TaxID=279828 RepID=A0A4Q7TJT5_9MICO|nr:acetate kinase [Microcella alkaliphila]